MKFIKSILTAITKILGFFSTYFKGIIIALILFFIATSLFNSASHTPPNLAKLHLDFPIMNSESFRTQVEEIKKNPSIKGVLLVINSPGGALGASVEIADMIAQLREKMPIIAYVQNLMASGAYYAGMYADKIYANRGTLIGSIGVIFTGINIEEALRFLGIKMQGQKAGIYKEAGTITRQWSKEESEMIATLTKQNYEMFCDDVIKARGQRLKSKEPKVFADGRVFNATDALNLGLIDSIGSMDSAIEELQNLSGVKIPVWLKKDRLSTLVDSITSSVIQGFWSKIISGIYM